MADAERAPVPDSVPSIVETHVGMVVLVGDRAYKSKKPVRTPFLDFSTPDRRTAALRRELELNRRISPDVYLGLGHFSGPEGPDETVLVMRRMPADRRLSTLVRAGAPVHDVLRDFSSVAPRPRRPQSASTTAAPPRRTPPPTLPGRWLPPPTLGRTTVVDTTALDRCVADAVDAWHREQDGLLRVG